MIFNTLYDYIALRSDRYLEIEAATSEGSNRKKSRRMMTLWLTPMAIVAAIASIAACFFLAPALLPLGVAVAGGFLFDAVSQGCFYAYGDRRFLNRKLSPITFLSTLLMGLSWAENPLVSLVSAPYYLLKDVFAKKKHFDDIVNRRAAYGRFLSTAPVVAIAVTLGLLANPFTGLPLLGLIAAITTTIAVGFLVIKLGEFLGKLSGVSKTQSDINHTMAFLEASLPGDKQITEFRTTSSMLYKIFNSLFEPTSPKNRKAGAVLFTKGSGSLYFEPASNKTIPTLLTENENDKKDVSLETTEGKDNIATLLRTKTYQCRL